jgi:catechol 2,3-dioxygenase-like lactoylglutathione lyase family enzyme
MIDHISLGTHQLPRAQAFYDSCLNTLGYTLKRSTDAEVIFGPGDKWVFVLYAVAAEEPVVAARMHVALGAAGHAEVGNFFAKAIEHGAIAVRQPGERPDVSPDYFGAIVRDLDGHTIEVVAWTH